MKNEINNLKGKVILNNSYDDGEYKNTDNKATGVIYFSSQLVSNDTTAKATSSTSNFSIHTGW